MNINVENNMLQVENLSHVPFNDLLSLFRQGYRLAEHGESAIELGLGIGLNVRNVDGKNIRSLATCPGSVQTGATLTLSASASSGTAPYTYHWTVTKPNGSTETLANQATNSYVVGLDGNYTVSVYVVDSCATGAKTSPTDSCNITASAGGGQGYNCSNCNTPVTGGTYPTSAQCVTACAGGQGYNCSNCNTPVTGGTYPTTAACQTACGTGGGGCDITTCPPDKNYCLAGQCIPKNYALYAGIGLVALLILK